MHLLWTIFRDRSWRDRERGWWWFPVPPAESLSCFSMGKMHCLWSRATGMAWPWPSREFFNLRPWALLWRMKRSPWLRGAAGRKSANRSTPLMAFRQNRRRPCPDWRSVPMFFHFSLFPARSPAINWYSYIYNRLVIWRRICFYRHSRRSLAQAPVRAMKPREII